MKLFLDCEFNGFGGELISMALVDEQGQYFYEALDCDDPVPWVQANILPILGQAPITATQFNDRLFDFLNAYPEIHIIADWPEDLALFSRALITAPGRCMTTPPLSMQLWMDRTHIRIPSKIQHYALADAEALAASYQASLEQHHNKHSSHP